MRGPEVAFIAQYDDHDGGTRSRGGIQAADPAGSSATGASDGPGVLPCRRTAEAIIGFGNRNRNLAAGRDLEPKVRSRWKWRLGGNHQLSRTGGRASGRL